MSKATLLPPEVCCEVIRCLDRTQDKRTLFACSLTCKAFLFISRRILFEAVVLFWPPARRSSDSRFIDLIRTSSPELGAAVKRLVLSFPDITTGPAPLILNAGADLGRGFPNVTYLQIRFMDWGTVDAESRSALLSSFQAVKRLDLMYPKFQFSHEAVGFILSFPMLAHLHIEGNAWTWRSIVVPRPRNQFLSVNLTTVAIAADNAEVFAELMGLEPHPKVQSLSLVFVRDHINHNYNVTSLLKALGDDLRELVFLNSMAMRAGARAPRNSNGEHTLKSSFLYTYNICTQASTLAITPNSATSHTVSGYQTLAVRSATFFRKSSRRSWSK